MKGMKMRWFITWPISVLFAVGAPALASPMQPSGHQSSGRVDRDDQGIPHIFAKTERDLYFLTGWMHAQDRFFQMDAARHQASGTLAELLGADALRSDVETRNLGIRRAAELSLAQLSKPVQKALEAYSAGVNAYRAEHSLPPEYAALEVAEVAPWTPLDSVTVAKAISYSLSFELDIGPTQRLRQYQDAGARGGFDGTALYFEDLNRAAPFDPAATVPDALERSGPGVRSLAGGNQACSNSPALGQGSGSDIDPLSIFHMVQQPAPGLIGSNEWVVSGRLTASGRPLLANDPHLNLTVPPRFYVLHQVTPDLDVSGNGFAGVPFIATGHNKSITWGVTTSGVDVTDTYRETIEEDSRSPSGLSTIFMGRREPVIPLPQEFRYNQPRDGVIDNLVTAPAGGEVNGVDIPAATLIVPRRNQGPIISLDREAGTALSIQFTGFSATRELDAFYSVNRARHMDEFLQALQFFDVGSQNFAYADIWGNIGFFTAGEVPLREDLQEGCVRGLPPFFVRDGTGGNEWLPVSDQPDTQATPFATVPFGEMPQVVNPLAGFFVNANNDPAGTTLDNDPLNEIRPGGGIYYLARNFGSLRGGRITEMIRGHLAEGRRISLEEMKAMQADTVLRDAEFFVSYLLDAFRNARAGGAPSPLAALGKDSRLAEAIRRLEAWDLTTPTGIPEGYDAADRDGRRVAPTAKEIADSVAATLYSVWRGQAIRAIVDATAARAGVQPPVEREALTALRHRIETFDRNQGVGSSGLDFFVVPGIADPPARRDYLLLHSLVRSLDLLAGDAFSPAFQRSSRQEDYRWGRLHRGILTHPLDGAFNVPPAFGFFPPPLGRLDGIPTDGGFDTVDPGSHDVRAADADAFRFRSAPASRLVAQAGPGRIRAESALPGGESGIPGSPFYLNLLGQWLTNDTFPLLASPRGAGPARHK
jgi:penicillin G amidase